MTIRFLHLFSRLWCSIVSLFEYGTIDRQRAERSIILRHLLYTGVTVAPPVLGTNWNSQDAKLGGTIIFALVVAFWFPFLRPDKLTGKSFFKSGRLTVRSRGGCLIVFLFLSGCFFIAGRLISVFNHDILGAAIISKYSQLLGVIIFFLVCIYIFCTEILKTTRTFCSRCRYAFTYLESARPARCPASGVRLVGTEYHEIW